MPLSSIVTTSPLVHIADPRATSRHRFQKLRQLIGHFFPESKRTETIWIKACQLIFQHEKVNKKSAFTVFKATFALPMKERVVRNPAESSDSRFLNRSYEAKRSLRYFPTPVWGLGIGQIPLARPGSSWVSWKRKRKGWMLSASTNCRIANMSIAPVLLTYPELVGLRNTSRKTSIHIWLVSCIHSVRIHPLHKPLSVAV